MVDGSELPEYIRRAIYGEMTLEEKRAAVDASTNNWWREYAARKNDEEEEHVADTLLYDERCHLPRTAPRPDVVPPDVGTSTSSVSSSAVSAPSDLPERVKEADRRAAQRGADAPEAKAAGDNLPEWLRKQIYGEQTAEEKAAMLKDAQSGWRKKRFTQLPVEGTTRGEFIDAGIIDGQSEAQRIVNLPFGSPERAAASSGI